MSFSQTLTPEKSVELRSRRSDCRVSVVLIGGIQINMPKPWEDHFQPLYYQVHQKGAEPVDILDDMCSF